MKCSICGKIVNQWYEDEKGKIYCSEKCLERTYPTCCVCGKPMKNWIESDNKKYCSDTCYQKSWPKCSVCGKPMKQWVESQGKKYCSDSCYQKTWPKCSVCGKPMKQWVESRGKKYCSDSCYQKTWPKCNVCGRPMKQWIESMGNKYCSETCYESSLPKCNVCGKPLKQWIETNNGKRYCDDHCFQKILPKCATCGKPVNGGIIDKSTQKIYCNNICYEKILPNCAICGKKMHHWIETKEGKKFCSERCLENILPTCKYCGKPMKNWIEYSGLGKFCNATCYQKYQDKSSVQIDTNTPLTAKELSYITGLTQDECCNIMQKNNIDGDTALEMIDTYMQSLNGGVEPPIATLSGLKNAGVHIKLAKNLSNYNTMRGGKYGYKGFVFEELHAYSESAKGANISVLNNNGPADFIEIDSSGKKILYQAKSVQKPNGKTLDNRYKDMTIVVDKGNTALLQKAYDGGFKVIESDISNKEAERIAGLQQSEVKMLGKENKKAPITANTISAHKAGIQSMKLAAKIGVGLNLGSNIYDFLDGNKELGEATIDTLFETAKTAGTAYVSGNVITFVGAKFAESAVGSAAIETAAAVGSVIADTAVGGFAVECVAGCVETIATVITTVTSAPLTPVFIAGTALLGFAWKALSDD